MKHRKFTTEIDRDNVSRPSIAVSSLNPSPDLLWVNDAQEILAKVPDRLPVDSIHYSTDAATPPPVPSNENVAPPSGS